jgi:hypothetical protein
VYKSFMPNQRASNQTLIAFSLNGELLRGLDAARGRKNRSEFIREAIAGELKRQGIALPPGAESVNDRVRIQRYPESAASGAELNEKPNSSSPSKLEAGIKKAVKGVQKRGVVYGRSQKAARTSGKTS